MVGGRDPVPSTPWPWQYSDPSALAAVHAGQHSRNAVVPHGAVVGPGQLGSSVQSGGLAQLAANRSLLQNYTDAAGQHSSLQPHTSQCMLLQHPLVQQQQHQRLAFQGTLGAVHAAGRQDAADVRMQHARYSQHKADCLRPVLHVVLLTTALMHLRTCFAPLLHRFA